MQKWQKLMNTWKKWACVEHHILALYLLAFWIFQTCFISPKSWGIMKVICEKLNNCIQITDTLPTNNNCSHCACFLGFKAVCLKYASKIGKTVRGGGVSSFDWPFYWQTRFHFLNLLIIEVKCHLCKTVFKTDT